MGKTDQQVDKVDAGTAIVIADGLPAVVREFLADANSAVEMTTEQTEIAIVSQILAAASLEDIFGASADLVHLGDKVGEVITVKDWRWQQSDYSSFPVYMVLTFTDEGSDREQLASCGSKTMMAQLYAAKRHNLLPADLTVHKATKATKAGFFPMRFLMALPAFPD